MRFSLASAITVRSRISTADGPWAMEELRLLKRRPVFGGKTGGQYEYCVIRLRYEGRRETNVGWAQEQGEPRMASWPFYPATPAVMHWSRSI